MRGGGYYQETPTAYNRFECPPRAKEIKNQFLMKSKNQILHMKIMCFILLI